ncbi:MAG TPA: DUF5671 domain-containing protein [Nitriliruptoraceae bacterium]|nr:DUF5671 domain-containing protein [Nitriliruptoraceae bacterium]
MVVGLFVGLLPLVVLAAIIAGIVRAARGLDVDWSVVVRQFFQHVIAVVLAFVAASGVSRLAALALEGPSLVDADTQLAGPVAFAVIGVPLYAATMWWLLGQARRDAAEARTLAWSLHIAVVGVVALVTSIGGVFELVDGLAGDGDGSWMPLATIVVWGGLWGWYRWLEQHRVGSPRWAVLHVIAGSAIGLGVLAVGTGQLVAMALDVVLFDQVVVADDAPWTMVAAIVVGGATWAVYWLRDGMARPRDGWWHGWVLLGGVFTGLVATLSSFGYLVWLVAVWLVGDPTGSAAQHFDEVPQAVATGVVGAAVWAYHRSLLAPRGQRARTEVDRVADLLLAGVGLLAAAGGFATILVAIVEAVTGPRVVDAGTDPVNTLLAAVTFLAVGAPVWWRAWGRVQRLAGSAPLGAEVDVDDLDDVAVAERGSTARRVYLFLLFGVGGLTALVSLLVAVTVGFEGLFGRTFGAETLSEMRVPLALLVTSAAVAGLHWRVYREDRDIVVEPVRRFPVRITLIGVADPDIVAALHEATDAKVTLWTRTDGVTPPWSPERLVELLDGHDDDHVVVVSRPYGPELMPVED